MTVFPRITAGEKREMKPSRGKSSGQAIPITPTGSWILIVAPYKVVSCNNRCLSFHQPFQYKQCQCTLTVHLILMECNHNEIYTRISGLCKIVYRNVYGILNFYQLVLFSTSHYTVFLSLLEPQNQSINLSI